jgi:DNA-binding GntR family transcriptional regulator
VSTIPPELTSPRPVVRHALSAQIADELRRQIIYGRLSPGTKLVQDDLCKVFGTSRMPVRDALRELTQEGFLVADGVSLAVANFSLDDLQDAYELEAVLHGWAARTLAIRGTAEDFAALEGIHEQMTAASDGPATAALNWEFHRTINLLTRSSKLLIALRSLTTVTPRDFAAEFPGSIAQSNAQHAAIMSAMRSGRADEVETLTRQHVQQTTTLLLRSMENARVHADD